MLLMEVGRGQGQRPRRCANRSSGLGPVLFCTSPSVSNAKSMRQKPLVTSGSACPRHYSKYLSKRFHKPFLANQADKSVQELQDKIMLGPMVLGIPMAPQQCWIPLRLNQQCSRDHVVQDIRFGYMLHKILNCCAVFQLLVFSHLCDLFLPQHFGCLSSLDRQGN